ncbi:MAG: DUF697 domain-containing protein [Anaerolineae bacterium]|nr:DUF697 domain-containing protein [Anaerolineae bacterium]
MTERRYIGLDIGTVNTSVCDTHFNASRVQFEEPAPVKFGAQREPVLRTLMQLDAAAQEAARTGKEALEGLDARRYPERIVSGFRVQLGQTPSAETYTRMFAAQVARRVAEEHFNVAALSPEDYVTVVGAPVAWTPERAARLSHVVAQAGFPNVEVLAEPAAVVTYHAFKGDILLDTRTQRWLVLDCGGATTSLTLVEIYSEGAEIHCTPVFNQPVGGQAFDQQLLEEWLLKERDLEVMGTLERLALLEFTREFKERFSLAMREGQESYTQYSELAALQDGVTLTRSEFEAATHALLDHFWAWWRLFPTDVEGLLLAGGGAEWYFVQDAADRFFPERWFRAESSILTVSKGLALARTGFRPATTVSVEPEIMEAPVSFMSVPLAKSIEDPQPDILAVEFASNRKKARAMAKKWAVGGGALALLVSPIPGVSQPFLTAIEVKLILDIAKLYGFKLKFEDILGTLLLLFVLGSVIKWGVMELATAIPIAGWAFKGGVAAAAIYGWGEAAIRYFETQRRKQLELSSGNSGGQ